MGTVQKQGDDRAWLFEQRYRAVLEVLDGSPASEVAVGYRCRGSRCIRGTPVQFVAVTRRYDISAPLHCLCG